MPFRPVILPLGGRVFHNGGNLLLSEGDDENVQGFAEGTQPGGSENPSQHQCA